MGVGTVSEDNAERLPSSADLAKIYEDLVAVIASLDGLGLHRASAYADMARHAIEADSNWQPNGKL